MAVILTDPLATFLRVASRRPFSWAEQWDCLMWLADYIQAVRGYDPAQPWRGRYRTPLGAARVLKHRGGPVAHLDGCLTPFGVCRTDAPQRGDIAVVDAPEGPTGAIVLGPRVVARLGVAGLRFGSLPVLAAWSI